MYFWTCWFWGPAKIRQCKAAQWAHISSDAVGACGTAGRGQDTEQILVCSPGEARTRVLTRGVTLSFVWTRGQRWSCAPLHCVSCSVWYIWSSEVNRKSVYIRIVCRFNCSSLSQQWIWWKLYMYKRSESPLSPLLVPLWKLLVLSRQCVLWFHLKPSVSRGSVRGAAVDVQSWLYHWRGTCRTAHLFTLSHDLVWLCVTDSLMLLCVAGTKQVAHK